MSLSINIANLISKISLYIISSNSIKLYVKISYIYLNLIVSRSEYTSDFDIQYNIMKSLKCISIKGEKAIGDYYIIYELI